MRRTEIDRLMREFYAAARGDLDAVCRSFSNDAGFQIASASQASPVAIKATGVDEFRPLLALLIKRFRLGDLTIRSMTIDGVSSQRALEGERSFTYYWRHGTDRVDRYCGNP